MVAIILAEPEHPGNIGSVCRIMANFGLSELIIINPKCELNQETRNLAKHAQHIVDKARITDWSVLDEFSLIAATAGVIHTDYNLTRTPLTPEEGAAKVAAVKAGAGSKGAALLFGRESNGLSNDELAKADLVIQIPTHYKYPSMNLSHAVGVMCYVLYMQKPVPKFTPIPATEKRILLEKIGEEIKALPFRTEGMRDTQRKLWKNVIGRAMLTKREAYAMFGFFRAQLMSRTPESTRAKRTPRHRK